MSFFCMTRHAPGFVTFMGALHLDPPGRLAQHMVGHMSVVRVLGGIQKAVALDPLGSAFVLGGVQRLGAVSEA